MHVRCMGRYINERDTEKMIDGKAILGIEFGSTRVKAVLIDESNEILSIGSYEWENKLENGIWTFHLEEILHGMQACYADLPKNVKLKYGVTITKLKAIGISGMMHGYMALDRNNQILTPFRTWRNMVTQEAAEILSQAFAFHIPQRWSIAHLYEAVRKNEEHVKKISYLTTLAGYIHLRLTNKKVIGIGEASGMFPIDTENKKYNGRMLLNFDKMIQEYYLPWTISEILPQILLAGQPAGTLTAEGAKLLDPAGNLVAGIPLCPPEGDAGTGMVATNSVAKRTGNVSAGTSIFGMVVLEKKLTKPYSEIDIVTTPSGDPVAMVHCNNCTSDLNAWVNLFREFADAWRIRLNQKDLYKFLYEKALEGEKDGGGLLAYNYLSGEHITHVEEGRPLFIRKPEAELNIANFMRTNLYSSLCTLAIGMEILTKQEHIKLESIMGHGGFFKTKGVGQMVLASALGIPVTTMETAGEGGAWGIAVLADYMMNGNNTELEEYLRRNVFYKKKQSIAIPKQDEVVGFEDYLKQYKANLILEQNAFHKCI